MINRLGIPYNEEIEKAWIKLIKANKVPCIQRQSNRITVWAVPVIGKRDNEDDVPDQVHVVYDSVRHSIVTVLFEDGPKI